MSRKPTTVAEATRSRRKPGDPIPMWPHEVYGGDVMVDAGMSDEFLAGPDTITYADDAGMARAEWRAFDERLAAAPHAVLLRYIRLLRRNLAPKVPHIVVPITEEMDPGKLAAELYGLNMSLLGLDAQSSAAAAQDVDSVCAVVACRVDDGPTIHPEDITDIHVSESPDGPWTTITPMGSFSFSRPDGGVRLSFNARTDDAGADMALRLWDAVEPLWLRVDLDREPYGKRVLFHVAPYTRIYEAKSGGRGLFDFSGRVLERREDGGVTSYGKRWLEVTEGPDGQVRDCTVGTPIRVGLHIVRIEDGLRGVVTSDPEPSSIPGEGMLAQVSSDGLMTAHHEVRRLCREWAADDGSWADAAVWSATRTPTIDSYLAISEACRAHGAPLRLLPR